MLKSCFKFHNWFFKVVKQIPVSKRVCVNFEKPSAVDENRWSHVADCDQLATVFYSVIGLFQGLENGHGLPRTETAHKLQQVGYARLLQRSIQIDAHLICSVNKFKIQALQQHLLIQLVLQKMCGFRNFVTKKSWKFILGMGEILDTGFPHQECKVEQTPPADLASFCQAKLPGVTVSGSRGIHSENN